MRAGCVPHHERGADVGDLVSPGHYHEGPTGVVLHVEVGLPAIELHAPFGVAVDDTDLAVGIERDAAAVFQLDEPQLAHSASIDRTGPERPESEPGDAEAGDEDRCRDGPAARRRGSPGASNARQSTDRNPGTGIPDRRSPARIAASARDPRRAIPENPLRHPASARDHAVHDPSRGLCPGAAVRMTISACRRRLVILVLVRLPVLIHPVREE